MLLIQEMNSQLDLVWSQVLQFKLEIKEARSKGLVKIKPDVREERERNIKEMFDALRSIPSKVKLEDQNQTETKTEILPPPPDSVFFTNATFEWFA
jgi:hypothetical protein